MSASSYKLTLLRPKWLCLHVLTIAMCVTMLWLGRWQWRAAIRHHGEMLNYAYAFQWWAFVCFTLLMWYRFVSDFLGKSRPGGPVVQAPPAPSRYVGYTPPPPTAEPETDPERIRFNAYLSELNESGLRRADLRRADLRRADSRRASVKHADREGAE